jgi:hypothetical protein
MIFYTYSVLHSSRLIPESIRLSSFSSPRRPSRNPRISQNRSSLHLWVWSMRKLSTSHIWLTLTHHVTDFLHSSRGNGTFILISLLTTCLWPFFYLWSWCNLLVLLIARLALSDGQFFCWFLRLLLVNCYLAFPLFHFLLMVAQGTFESIVSTHRFRLIEGRGVE